MKIIDLINKIANGEEVPMKIKYRGIEFTYIWTNRKPLKYVNEAYEDANNAERHLFWYVESFDDEVEILDVEEDKDIPLIPDDELWVVTKKGGMTIDNELGIDRYVAINSNFKVLKDQINIIIKEFNEYRKEEK